MKNTSMEETKLFQKAVAMMDRQFPGWHFRIDLERFDMASSEDCVLGQVTSRYSFGVQILASKESDFGEVRCVFFSPDWSDNWKHLIRNRQNATSPAGVVTVKFSDGSLMNFNSIKDVPFGVSFTIYEESVS